MASADPTDVPATDPAEEPYVDAFGPPHAQSVSESLQLWILIPGLIGLILIGESSVYIRYTCTIASSSGPSQKH